MVYKEKKIKFLILISKYRYKSNTDLDYYYFITDSLKYCNYKYLSVEFNKKNKIINLKQIISFLRKKNIVILAEANIEYNYLYSNTLIDLITKSKHPIISFFGDFDQHQIKSKFVNISKAIFVFDKTGVEWGNKQTDTKKFFFLYSFPIPRFKKISLREFKNRPYDFNYVGSNKNFRTSFIAEFLRIYGNKLSSLIISSNSRFSLLNSYYDFFKSLLLSKYAFCTRASLYERLLSKKNYFFNVKKSIFLEGRRAGRISQAVAAGCIPIYWQPKVPNNSFSALFLKNRFRKFRMLNNYAIGDENSRPDDNFDEKFKKMMIIVKKPSEIYNYINSEKKINQMWKMSNVYYNKYVHPKVFFKKLDLILKNIKN
jgi:hypothetical protein